MCAHHPGNLRLVAKTRQSDSSAGGDKIIVPGERKTEVRLVQVHTVRALAAVPGESMFAHASPSCGTPDYCVILPFYVTSRVRTRYSILGGIHVITANKAW